MKSLALLSGLLLLAGCQAAPATLIATPAGAPVPAQVAAAPAMPEAPQARQRVESQAPDPFAPFRRLAARGGLVADFRHLIPEDGAYQVQLVPQSTETRAREEAAAWASDARQLFVGWGYWKHPLVGFARHGFYSPSKRKALMLDYAVSKRYLHARTEEDGEKYEEAAFALRDAADTHRYTARAACELAKEAGYIPEKLHVGALMHMALYGPAWVFLDDRDWSPYVIVRADTGEVVKSGPMMEAARLLIQPHQKS